MPWFPSLPTSACLPEPYSPLSEGPPDITAALWHVFISHPSQQLHDPPSQTQTLIPTVVKRSPGQGCGTLPRCPASGRRGLPKEFPPVPSQCRRARKIIMCGQYHESSRQKKKFRALFETHKYHQCLKTLPTDIGKD